MRYLLLLLLPLSALADTIDNYMNIATHIPQMEMKADAQSQAWARSARNILAITTESIAETLLQANQLATIQGSPLFCLPPSMKLSSPLLDNLIQQTYKEISSQQSDKNTMTVSQVAWLGMTKRYPCKEQAPKPSVPLMQHIGNTE